MGRLRHDDPGIIRGACRAKSIARSRTAMGLTIPPTLGDAVIGEAGSSYAAGSRPTEKWSPRPPLAVAKSRLRSWAGFRNFIQTNMTGGCAGRPNAQRRLSARARGVGLSVAGLTHRN
jgi:hypothetical protein